MPCPDANMGTGPERKITEAQDEETESYAPAAMPRGGEPNPDVIYEAFSSASAAR
jgi:hypothetical protein